jgi:hypothetical protein
VAHIGCREGPHIACREVAHMGKSREAVRMAPRREVARIVGCRDPVRSRDRQTTAGHRRRQEPRNLARKRRRESQPFRQIRK